MTFRNVSRCDWVADLKQFCIDNPVYWEPPSEEVPPWNKGKPGLQKDSPETKEKKRLAKLGKKRGSYKTSVKWTTERRKKSCASMKKAWTPERRAALAERNRKRFKP